MATRECAVDLVGRIYYQNCLELERKATAARRAMNWTREPLGQLSLPIGIVVGRSMSIGTQVESVRRRVDSAGAEVPSLRSVHG